MIRHIFVVASICGIAVGALSAEIDPTVISNLRNGGVINVIVSFADTKQVLNNVESVKFATREAKLQSLKNGLESLATESQKNVIGILKSKNAHFKSFWINNRVFIQNANEDMINAIATLPEVVEIRQEKVLDILRPTEEEKNNNTILLEWGIERIEALRAWALPGGNNGQGVVVSIIDTGVRSTHEALKNNHRRSYGWFDPYTRTEEPSDQNGHGTHVMGTLAGAGGIGVAPGAQWIACRGCSSNSCDESALTECGQWIVCPTLANGEAANCRMAPRVVSNSWGGGQGQTWYDSVIDSWHVAGIVPVFAMGNSGPPCGTASSPGDRPNVIGVGSTNNADAVSPSSSRGPTVDGIIKPDVSAPGTNIRSAGNSGDTNYATMSGTSMATPHVSGLVALLLSQNPSLTFDQIKNLIQENADRELGNASTCGGTPPNVFPNNIYGHGRINAFKSLNAAING